MYLRHTATNYTPVIPAVETAGYPNCVPNGTPVSDGSSPPCRGGGGGEAPSPYRVPNGTPQCSLSCGAMLPTLQSTAPDPTEHSSLSSSA